MPNITSQVLPNPFYLFALYDRVMSIGSRLRQLRLANKLSGEKFGELVGVTKGTVSQWESDAIQPTIPKLIDLQQQLNFSLDWLLAGENQPHTAYSTTDPDLVTILQALEPRAKYIKEAARESVLNACKLADQVHAADAPQFISHRLPSPTTAHDIKNDWVFGTGQNGKKKSGSSQ